MTIYISPDPLCIVCVLCFLYSQKKKTLWIISLCLCLLCLCIRREFKMQSHHLLLEEPMRMASILEPSRSVSFHQTNEYYFVCVCVFWNGEMLINCLIFFYHYCYLKLFCRISFLLCRRSWERLARNRDQLTLFLIVWMLECQVSFLFFTGLGADVFF